MKCLAGHEGVRGKEPRHRGNGTVEHPYKPTPVMQKQGLGGGGQACCAGLGGADSHPRPGQKEEMEEGILGGCFMNSNGV